MTNKNYLRKVLLFFFNTKPTAAESHRMLIEAYGDHTLLEKACRNWFERFKSGDFLCERQRTSRSTEKVRRCRIISITG